jgi:hypothetical protein
VVEAWLGIKTEFIRTPKFNLEETGDSWIANQYVKLQLKPIVWFEIVYLFYCSWLAFKTIQLQLWGLLPFYLMIISGLCFVLYFTFRHGFVRNVMKKG